MFVNLDPNKEEKNCSELRHRTKFVIDIFHISVNVFLIAVLIPYPHYTEERFACQRVPRAQSQTNIPMKEQESIIKI